MPKTTEETLCHGASAVIEASTGARECRGAQVRVRSTRTDIETTMDCYERELEPLCAPVNCRFEERGSECMDTVKVINVSTTLLSSHSKLLSIVLLTSLKVTLTESTCEMCRPVLMETIEQKRVCTDFLDRTCADGEWVKTCEGDEEGSNSNREPRDNEEYVRKRGLFSFFF